MPPQPHDLQIVPGDADLPYFVVGGRYLDTTFTNLTEADPAAGPFETYDEAVEVWRAASIKHIDEAFVRYIVVQAADAEDAQSHAVEPDDRSTTRSA